MTKQVDIDIYYDLGGKMEVKNIDDEDGIILKIPRMKKKKPELVDFDNSPVKSGMYSRSDTMKSIVTIIYIIDGSPRLVSSHFWWLVTA